MAQVQQPQRVVVEVTYPDGSRYRLTMDERRVLPVGFSRPKIRTTLGMLGSGEAEFRAFADNVMVRDRAEQVRFTADTDGEARCTHHGPPGPGELGRPKVTVAPGEDLHMGVVETLTIDFGELGAIATDPRFEQAVRALADDANSLRELRHLLSGANREELQNWVAGIRKGTWDPTPATKDVLGSVLGAFLAWTSDEVAW